MIFSVATLVSFWCPNVCFHTQNYVDFSTTVFLYHLSFCSDMDLFVTQRMHEGHTPLGKNLEIELSETPYPAFPGSNAINSYKSILSRFSQSLVIHGSQAEVQRFMIPKFLKTKTHDSYKFCNYDSLFMIPLSPFHPRLRTY